MLDIAGLADSTATVTVNSQSTQRQGEHGFKQLALSGNSAQWQSVSVSISTGGSSSGSVLLKEHPEVYAYDDDGNLTSDGRWTYTWDADGARQRGDGAPQARPQGRGGRAPTGRTTRQNRLRRMETASLAYTAGAPRKRIDCAYDDRGRRTLKSVYTWNTSTSAFNTTPAAKVGFLYHDWNLLQEVDLSGSSPATLRSYYWGLDLSGTLQGAGGVGGLLAGDFNHTLLSYDSAFYVSDANGNVSDLTDIHGFAAHYEYDAFGAAFPENTGWINLASLNPFRFSTKYTETDAASAGNETGLLYYGYRFYSPSIGRWPTRDPIGIKGGLNLYGMVENNPVDYWDALGHSSCGHKIRVAHVRTSVEGFPSNTEHSNSSANDGTTCYVGCELNELNQHQAENFPEQAAGTEPIPIEIIQEDASGAVTYLQHGVNANGTINSDELTWILEAKIEAVQRDLCKRGCCWVKITIECGPNFGVWKDPNKRCGKTLELPCINN